MRINQIRNQIPKCSASGRSIDRQANEEARFVWEKLAPRLLHPSKVAFIQALLKHGQPLTLSELAESAGITKERARYQCKSMQKAGVLEIVSVATCADGNGDEPSYYFPKPPQSAPARRA